MHLTSEARTMLLVALDGYIKSIDDGNDALIEKFLELESAIANYDPVDDMARLRDAQINSMIVDGIDAAERAEFENVMGHAMRAEQSDLEDFLAGLPCDSEPSHQSAKELADERFGRDVPVQDEPDYSKKMN